ACSGYDGEFLFPDAVAGLPSVIHLPPIVPAEVNSVEALEQATIFAEVGAPQTAAGGGITFNFVGDGGDICLFVDPELVSWNQAVGRTGNAKYRWPTNVFTDGDLDLKAGLAVYYTGSPGEQIGD